jgi:hypothetical protein
MKTIADRSLLVKTGSNSDFKKTKNRLFVRVLNTGILPIGRERIQRANVSV